MLSPKLKCGVRVAAGDTGGRYDVFVMFLELF